MPFTAYHGRIPFIVVDVISHLRSLKAVHSPDLFNEQLSKPVILKAVREALNVGPISDWSNYTDIATLSTLLLRYLSNGCKETPLIEP